MRQSPFCIPECKTALADLWTHSIDCLNKMRIVVQQRAPETAGVPLSATVPRYIDAVGEGNRTDKFVKIKSSAMVTVCGTSEWAEYALK
eukprot:11303068-Alexandrium_andersonii.AAC.1